jgi:ribosomal protein L10
MQEVTLSEDDSELQKLKNLLAPRKLEWQDFEDEVTQYLERQSVLASLGLLPQTAKVQKKPRYFSKLRESEITFDVSIEVWCNQKAPKASLIWIWECKNYPNRNVSVDEVEEFHDKLRQVGAHKGTIVSRFGFATGAVTLAKSYGIALLTLEKEEVAYLAMSKNQGLKRIIEIVATNSYSESGQDILHDDIANMVQSEFSRIRKDQKQLEG